MLKLRTWWLWATAVFLLSGQLHAQVRPLVNRAVEECNLEYLQAIKPTTAEITYLTLHGLQKVLDALYEMDQAELTTAALLRESKAGRIVMAEQSTQALQIQSQRKTAATHLRDQCWNFVDGVKSSSNDLGAGLLKISYVEKGAVYMVSDIVEKLIRKGASVDMTITLNSGSIETKSSLFPRLVEYLSVLPNTIDTFANIKSQRQLALTQLLVAHIAKPTTLDAHASVFDVRVSANSFGPTALGYAVMAGNDAMINLLLDSGADLMVLNPGGRSGPNAGKSLVDLYTGKEMGVVKRLMMRK